MRLFSFRKPWRVGCLLATTVVAAALPDTSFAQRFVPGTGREVVGDDFEDENWGWIPNEPKSSENIDSQNRYPLGGSNNGAWVESALRGQPDAMRRVPTPEGGLPGSQGALALRSLATGIPGRLTNEMQQDDLVLNGSSRLGYSLSAGMSPSAVVRVWLPPFDQWEDRTGSHFGIRGDCVTTKYTEKRRFFRKKQVAETEMYWPGYFIQFNSKTDGANKEDSAVIIIRGDETGNEIAGPRIKQTGWWTFGMSFTPDGRVHYYASPGVDPLTEADYITSQFPYGYRCERMNTIFFNVVNQDNGRNWSTEFIVDDPKIYVLR